MVCVHPYLHLVRIFVQDLNAPNSGLSGTSRFVDGISAAKLQDKLTAREIRTPIGNRVAHLKDQAVSIPILDYANDFSAFKNRYWNRA
jgi:hypothetical protein